MKSSLSILILSTLVFIAIFGAFSIGNMDEHGQGCWATTINGAVCPESMSPMASINFHSDALAKFSLAIFQDTLLLLLLLTIIFVVLRTTLFKVPSIIQNANFFHRNKNLKLNQNKFVRWLSLLENSPSYLK